MRLDRRQGEGNLALTESQQKDAQALIANLRQGLAALDHHGQRARYGWSTVDDGLRSWAPNCGGGGGTGGHADPIGSAIAGSVTTRFDRRRRWTMDTLVWLAARLDLTGPPLDALDAALPRLRPSALGQLVLWLAELDERVSTTLGGRSDR